MNRVHDDDYTGPRREFTVYDGDIGCASYSIDGAGCTLKLYDAPNPGGWTQVYYDNRTDAPVHRRLCVREACKLMGLQPSTTDARTQQMLGGGVDGHVLRALLPAISSHIASFKQSTLPTAYVQLPPVMTSTDVPPELAHRRFACPGRKAEKQLGWQRDETSVCANCCAGKLQRADICRDPVSKIQ